MGLDQMKKDPPRSFKSLIFWKKFTIAKATRWNDISRKVVFLLVVSLSLMKVKSHWAPPGPATFILIPVVMSAVRAAQIVFDASDYRSDVSEVQIIPWTPFLPWKLQLNWVI